MLALESEAVPVLHTHSRGILCICCCFSLYAPFGVMGEQCGDIRDLNMLIQFVLARGLSCLLVDAERHYGQRG